jgi:hypothetical protein
VYEKEELPQVSKSVFGAECMAANVVLGFNKLRYKMGSGDPYGFSLFFVKNNLPLLLLPRYRGN